MVIKEKEQRLTREAVIMELYKTAFPEVAAFVHKMGGSLAEAKDIFQDALVVYYEKKLEADFAPKHGHSAYLKGIAKHLWYKNFRKAKLSEPLTHETLRLTEEAEGAVSSKLLQFLELSGQRCLEVLSAFYFEQLSMKAVAQRFGFSGERSATAQKFKCLEKVRGAIRERTLSKADFYE